MLNTYQNSLGSERTVETIFVHEMLSNYYQPNFTVLDVGGIPTKAHEMQAFYNYIAGNNIDFRICDFRGGQYQGDFVQLDFENQKFDIVIFLSSLEHFPQCTESDVIFREGYDRSGYEKALSILNPGGKVFLTVPFGKHVWQPYHQNYDMQGILDLTRESTIIEQHTYRLYDEEQNGPRNGYWKITDPTQMTDILYTDRAFGVGCFVLQKN